MPLPLREPFFLKGRTSVVQRAVIMSVVLGGLASLAGWCCGFAYLVAPYLVQPGRGLIATEIAWATSSVLLIFVPLNYWNRSSQIRSVTCLLLMWEWIEPDGLIPRREFETDPIYVYRDLLFLGLAVGLPHLRCRRLHLIAFASSGVLLQVRNVLPNWLMSPRVPESLCAAFPMLNLIDVGSPYATEIAALSIPWGIPFWWPPEKDAGAEASPP